MQRKDIDKRLRSLEAQLRTGSGMTPSEEAEYEARLRSLPESDKELLFSVIADDYSEAGFAARVEALPSADQERLEAIIAGLRA